MINKILSPCGQFNHVSEGPNGLTGGFVIMHCRSGVVVAQYAQGRAAGGEYGMVAHSDAIKAAVP